VKPSNRRVARPKLPEGVTDGSGIDRPSWPDEEPDAGPIDLRPPSRVAGIARAILGVALVVGLSGSAAYGARHYVTTTARFAVKDIVVSGNARRSVDDVASEAGVAKGANVFSLDLDRARARLLADPWIQDASLARRLPGTVTIQVTERDAAAIVALGDSYLASRDGEIFKRLEPGDPTDLPVVTGLSPDSVAEDRDGAVQSVRRALDLAAEYDRSSIATRMPLQEVHLADDGAFSLVVGKGGVSLTLGGPPFHRKLDEAARVIAELEHRGAKPDTIMLDNEARPERVVVRVR
jgi:cell division protein FtsQ